MKTYNERRIELQNPQILKKMLEKSRKFLSLEQLSEPKSLVVEYARETYGCGQHWRPFFDSSFEWKEC